MSPVQGDDLAYYFYFQQRNRDTILSQLLLIE